MGQPRLIETLQQNFLKVTSFIISLFIICPIIFSTSPLFAKELVCSVFLTNTSNVSPQTVIKIEDQSAKVGTYTEDLFLTPPQTDQLLSILFKSSKDDQNLTAARVEERYIVNSENLNDIVSHSSLQWSLRDPKPEGMDFTTITAYAGKIVLPLNSYEKGNIKIRMRKYYRHKANEQFTPQNAEEIFKNFTVLELKISGISQSPEGELIPLMDGVYKIRAFIPDILLEKIIKFTASDFNNKEKIQSFVEQITQTPYGNGLFNDPDEVRQLFEALTLFSGSYDQLFNIQTVISYNRDSYTTTVSDGYSYQLTVDKNIHIFNPKDIKISRLSDYVLESPAHSVPSTHSFIELKSSVKAITEAATSYTQLNVYLLNYHIQGLNRAGGKFSLSQKTNEFKLEKAFELYQQNTLSSQMSSEGMLYFLIKGTANLPAPPNRKKIVEQGEVNIAIPFEVENQTYRVLLEYKPYILNGERYGFIDKFNIIDQAGKKIELNSKISLEIPKDIKAPHLPPAQVLINNTRIAFPKILSPTTMTQYKEFFSQFYTNYSKLEGNPREIEDLLPISNDRQLQKYIYKMKFDNTMKYLWSRFHRVATQAAIIAGVSISVTYFTLEYKEAQDQEADPFSTNTLDNTTGEIIEPGVEVQSANGNNRFLIIKGPAGDFVAVPIEPPL